MTTLIFDRMAHGTGRLYFDRFINVNGSPTISAVSTLRDGAAITIDGTNFSASGNLVLLVQGLNQLAVPIATEGTTQIVTTALDVSGLYLTQPVSVFVIDALGNESLPTTATILPKAGESVFAITQEFLGDGSTRAESSPDLQFTDEVRIRNVVGGVIGDVQMTGQGAFTVPTALTSFDYAVFDGSLLGPYASATWASPTDASTVPEIEDLLFAEAEAAVIAAGYTPSVVASVQSADIDLGRVVAQFPPAGTELVRGGVVEITVSLGLTGVLVPRLTGQPRTVALDERLTAGLTGQTFRDIDGNASDIVLNQSIAAGTPVEVGTAVDIVVSSGLAPNVIGQVLQQGEATIISANLDIDPDNYTQGYNPAFPVGTIAAQSPAPDTPVSPNQKFRFTVSVGPGVIVPPTQVSASPTKPANYDAKRAAVARAAQSISTRR